MQLEQHPILFQFTDNLQAGALALKVKASGRAILMRQYGEWWMYGVNPAIAAPGATDDEARDSFREAYREALQAIIEEAGQDKAKIRRTVHQFIKQTCEPDEVDWLKSVDALRCGEATIPEPLNSMPRRESRENDIAVRVRIKEQAKPDLTPGVVDLSGTIEASVAIRGSLDVGTAQRPFPPARFGSGSPDAFLLAA